MTHVLVQDCNNANIAWQRSIFRNTWIESSRESILHYYIQMFAAWFTNKLFKQAPNMVFLNMAYNS